MIATDEYFSSRKITDKLKIQFALRQALSPAMIPDQDKCVFIRYCFPAILLELLLVIFPYPIMQLPRCLQLGLIMQMQIADRI